MGLLTTDKREVTQDNYLVRASYYLPLNAKRFLSLLISKINPMSIPGGMNATISVTTTADEWAEYFGHNNSYKSMKEAADALYECSIRFPPEAGFDDTRRRWIYSESTYSKGMGKVKVTFTPEVTMLITDLYEQFTKYSLLDTLELNSTHSFRIYELLKQFKSTGVYCVNVSDLKHILGIDEKYPKYADFKRFVVNKAISNINATTDIDVILFEHRKGRKVHSLRFEFTPKKQADLLNKPSALTTRTRKN